MEIQRRKGKEDLFLSDSKSCEGCGRNRLVGECSIFQPNSSLITNLEFQKNLIGASEMFGSAGAQNVDPFVVAAPLFQHQLGAFRISMSGESDMVKSRAMDREFTRFTVETDAVVNQCAFVRDEARRVDFKGFDGRKSYMARTIDLFTDSSFWKGRFDREGSRNESGC